MFFRVNLDDVRALIKYTNIIVGYIFSRQYHLAIFGKALLVKVDEHKVFVNLQSFIAQTSIRFIITQHWVPFFMGHNSNYFPIDKNLIVCFYFCFSSNKISELPSDVTNAMICLEVIMKSHEETRGYIEKLLPKPLLDFKTLPTN